MQARVTSDTVIAHQLPAKPEKNTSCAERSYLLIDWPHLSTANFISSVAKGVWCAHNYFKGAGYQLATKNAPLHITGATGPVNSCKEMVNYYCSQTGVNSSYTSLHHTYKQYEDDSPGQLLPEHYHLRIAALNDVKRHGLLYTQRYAPIDGLLYEMHAHGYPISINAYGARAGNQLYHASVDECSMMVHKLAQLHKRYGSTLVLSLLFDLTNTAHECAFLDKIGETWATLDLCWVLQKAISNARSSLLSRSFLKRCAPYFFAALRELSKNKLIEDVLDSLGSNTQTSSDFFQINWAIECAQLCMTSGILVGLSFLVENDECSIQEWLQRVVADDALQKQCVRLVTLFLSCC